jgi:hypothetical protein
MNKQAVKMMIKRAKESALDKAMAAAEKAGKPTTSGIVTGAGLGTILAAIGALNRSGQDPDETSALSNPLLLGALGATGGYLAGNAFERHKPKRSTHEMSLSALAGLLGGTGIAGTMLAKEDAKDLLTAKKQKFDDILGMINRNARIPEIVAPDGTRSYDLGKTERTRTVGRGRNARTVTDTIPINRSAQDIKEFNDAQKELSKAYRRAGDELSAIRETGFKRPEKLGRRALEWLRSSSYSPVNWLRSMNPFTLSVKPGGEAGLKLLGSRFGNIITRNPKLSSLAALSLLAGGGKAIYDYTKD